MFQKPAVVRTQEYSDPNRKIEIFYPIISGLVSTSIQYSINHSIIKALNQLLKERSYYEPSLVELKGWFEVKTNQRGIISLALYVYSYTGGAHDMTTIRTLTLKFNSFLSAI